MGLADGHSTWRKHVRRWLPALAIAMALVTLCGGAAELWWGFELITHFTLQQLVLGLLVAATCADLRMWRWAGVALIPVGVGAWLVLPSYMPRERPAALEAPLRVMTFNMHGSSDNATEVAAFVGASDCDVVALLEVSLGVDEVLAQIDGYRLAAVQARADNFGLALLTRLPDLRAELMRLPNGDAAAIEATVPRQGKVWHLLALHTWPPVQAERAQERNVDLRFAAAWARRDGHRIVLGDLNVTPYSPYFRNLLDRGNLVDSRRGFGVQATWPQWPSFLAWARIPIDHILHDPGLTTTTRRVGPALGSDHRPVIATLATAAGEQGAFSTSP